MENENQQHPNSTPQTGRSAAEIQQWMIIQLAEELQISQGKIKVDQSILSCGIDSMQVITFVAKLEDWLDIRFSGNPLEEHSTIEKLSQYVADMTGESQ